MSDKPIPALDAEQVKAVSGGLECTPEQLVTLASNLTQAYESLVDFTSHVMERVSQ